MKYFVLTCALVLSLSFPQTTRSLPPAQHFPSEQAAMQHCPSDVVVWVNLPTQVYHFKGERWYGRTKDGTYVCKKEADAEGDRPTRNGQ
jgi:hypothetical protein